MSPRRRFARTGEPSVRTDACRCLATIVLIAGLVPGHAGAADSAAERTEAAEVGASWSELAPSERLRAATWELTATEWRRYRTLMDGLRGSVSPDNLSPIEVLGIHARTAAERRRYAERWAVLMREDAERILAFQRAYDTAYNRLFPGEMLIDAARLPARAPAMAVLQPDDRLLVFVRPDCPVCEAVLQRALSKRGQVRAIDLYVQNLGRGDEAAIRNWAARQGIDPAWVHRGEVTLNFDAGTLERLTEGEAALPYLMRRRGESVTTLPGSAL